MSTVVKHDVLLSLNQLGTEIFAPNSITIYISFLLFFYILLTVFDWLILFSFIKGLSIWKDVGPCPIGISVFAYERRYHLWGVLTSEI